MAGGLSSLKAAFDPGSVANCAAPGPLIDHYA